MNNSDASEAVAQAQARRPLVVYHAGCLDGDASAWCFHNKDKTGYEFLPGKYQDGRFDQQVYNGIFSKRTVYLVDFSYPVELMKRLLAVADQVVVLDHHKTALDMLEAFKDVVNLDISHCTTEKSGCGICWEYLNPGSQLPVHLAYVQDRDLWQFNFNATDPFCEAMGNIPGRDYTIFDLFKTKEDYKPIIDMGISLITARQSRINSCVHRATQADADGCDGQIWVVNSTADISELGNELCKIPFSNSGELPKYALIWYVDREVVKYCLRSVGDFDVSIIAKRYGGGGHKNAAGYSIKTENIES